MAFTVSAALFWPTRGGPDAAPRHESRTRAHSHDYSHAAAGVGGERLPDPRGLGLASSIASSHASRQLPSAPPPSPFFPPHAHPPARCPAPHMSPAAAHPAPAGVDVTIFGATGFTGKLIAEYLATHPTQPSFALAGRSEPKLAAVRAALPRPKADVPLIVANVADAASLAAMVARSRVIINVVGPFGQHNARALVAECIRQKKHYADLTGESRYYADLLRDYADAAQHAGSVIVPSAGFDCRSLFCSSHVFPPRPSPRDWPAN